MLFEIRINELQSTKKFFPFFFVKNGKLDILQGVEKT